MSYSRLHPLRIGEIVVAGTRLYGRNPRTMLTLAATVIIPLQALVFIVDVSVVKSPQRVPGDALLIATAAGRHVNGSAALLGGVISAFIGVLASAVLVRVASERYLGRKVGVVQSLRFILGRIGPILWLTIIMYLGLICAFIALALPGIYLYAAWSVALPVLVIEGLGASTSLGRSLALVKGRWWPVAAVVLAMTVIAFIVADGFNALVLGVIGRGPTALSSAAVTNVAIALGAVIANPFHSAVTTVLYHDLRIRHESFAPAAPAEPQSTPKFAARKPRPSIGPPPGESALERIFRSRRR